MSDIFAPAKRSAIMSAIRGRENKSTELRLIQLFRKLGVTGWRRGLPMQGRPDFVFRNRRIAIFVDGCFWHSCPKHGRTPTSRIEYWAPKLRRNQERDIETNAILRRNGWIVLRIWEHDLRRNRVKFVERRLMAALLKESQAQPVLRSRKRRHREDSGEKRKPSRSAGLRS